MNAHLAANDYLLGRYSVADAYLVVVLNWAQFSGVDLAAYPATGDYLARLRQRPQVARAMAEEMDLYRRRQAS